MRRFEIRKIRYEMEVMKFTIEASTQNKDSFILVAETKEGHRFVVSGNPYFPNYLTPYEDCFYTQKNGKN